MDMLYCLQDEIIKKPIIAIPIPEMLRAMLVQDWENINKSQLVSVNVTDKGLQYNK